MGYFLFSEDWVEECIKEMKKGPDPERKKSIHSNYWKWVEQCKRKMDIRLALVLKDDEHGSSFAYFVLKQGEVEDGYLGKADERGTANFVLAANREDWKEILEGPRDITQNIMYRKINLVQGNLHSFFRSIYFFVELLRCMTRVPTLYHLEKEPS